MRTPFTSGSKTRPARFERNGRGAEPHSPVRLALSVLSLPRLHVYESPLRFDGRITTITPKSNPRSCPLRRKAIMCFGDVLRHLRASGFDLTPVQLRWAVVSGKVSRPSL